MTIQEQVIAILAEQAMLEPSDIDMNQTLEDIGIESLGLVESNFEIEEAFDVTVPFNANNPTETAFDISSVGSIVQAVTQLKMEQAK